MCSTNPPTSRSALTTTTKAAHLVVHAAGCLLLLAFARVPDSCLVLSSERRHRCSLTAATQEYVDKFDPATGKTYKDRIALLALLRFVKTEQRVVVVSTHLTRNPEDPKMDALRAKQIGQVLRKITEFTVANKCVDDTPVVLAGDLNA